MNFLQYTEYASDGSIRKRFSWVTDLTITRDNARHLVRGGRARWKIENETFNTLKNQDYHLEHNFGHGEQNLSVVFAMLMMLAFLSRPNTGTLLSPVSSRSQKARQPTIVVGPPTFPLPSLPLRIHAAASGSHPLRLGQGDDNSLLRITPSGESSLSPFSSQHRGSFLVACYHVPLNVYAEVLEKYVASGMGSENPASFTNSIGPHAARTSPLLSNLRSSSSSN